MVLFYRTYHLPYRSTLPPTWPLPLPTTLPPPTQDLPAALPTTTALPSSPHSHHLSPSCHLYTYNPSTSPATSGWVWLVVVVGTDWTDLVRFTSLPATHLCGTTVPTLPTTTYTTTAACPACLITTHYYLHAFPPSRFPYHIPITPPPACHLALYGAALTFLPQPAYMRAPQNCLFVVHTCLPGLELPRPAMGGGLLRTVTRRPYAACGTHYRFTAPACRTRRAHLPAALPTYACGQTMLRCCLPACAFFYLYGPAVPSYRWFLRYATPADTCYCVQRVLPRRLDYAPAALLPFAQTTHYTPFALSPATITATPATTTTMHTYTQEGSGGTVGCSSCYSQAIPAFHYHPLPTMPPFFCLPHSVSSATTLPFCATTHPPGQFSSLAPTPACHSPFPHPTVALPHPPLSPTTLPATTTWDCLLPTLPAPCWEGTLPHHSLFVLPSH